MDSRFGDDGNVLMEETARFGRVQLCTRFILFRRILSRIARETCFFFIIIILLNVRSNRRFENSVHYMINTCTYNIWNYNFLNWRESGIDRFRGTERSGNLKRAYMYNMIIMYTYIYTSRALIDGNAEGFAIEYYSNECRCSRMENNEMKISVSKTDLQCGRAAENSRELA